MIKIYYIDETDTETKTGALTEDNWWGDIIDGDVATSIEKNGPSDMELEEYIDVLNKDLLSGVIDPIAVVEHLQHGPVRAAVPSERNPSTLYTGSNAHDITLDGKLSVVEQHEANKYVSRKSENNDTLYKDYELTDDFKQISISQRTGKRTEEVARINIDTNSVDDMKEGKEHEAKSHIEYLLEQTPILNPVAVTQENNKSRIAGVVNPNTEPGTEELITNPNAIKKPPEEIKTEILTDKENK